MDSGLLLVSRSIKAGTNEFVHRPSALVDKKNVVPVLQAALNMLAFYHDKDIVMLKLGCTLLTMASFYLLKPTHANFYPFTEGKLTMEIIGDDTVGEPCFVSTRKAAFDGKFMRKSTNICKSIVRIDVDQKSP